jgi:hypothetical protein
MKAVQTSIDEREHRDTHSEDSCSEVQRVRIERQGQGGKDSCSEASRKRMASSHNLHRQSETSVDRQGQGTAEQGQAKYKKMFFQCSFGAFLDFLSIFLNCFSIYAVASKEH